MIPIKEIILFAADKSEIRVSRLQGGIKFEQNSSTGWQEVGTILYSPIQWEIHNALRAKVAHLFVHDKKMSTSNIVYSGIAEELMRYFFGLTWPS